MVSEEQRNSALTLNSQEFDFICRYVHERTGIVLGEGKREMVYRRFSRIIRDRGLASFSDYCRLLKANPEQEQTYFINAITTNLTSFFREQHHFDYLGQQELPALLAENGQKRLRIWSSACSTGEEPYSIAICLSEAMQGQLSRWDVKVLATDIDSNVLSKAQQGIYDRDKIADLPQEIKSKYFQKGTGSQTDKIRVAGSLSELITFKQLNLLHQWPMKGVFDVIFCRNVIIYFDKDTQQDLFARYYEYLKPGGLLMLGHSESLGEFQKYFDNIGRTIFRKPLAKGGEPLQAQAVS
ncbi:protein-glutamate O-methyltransferase CheR [Thalassomonas viridans]|uniref:Chemotaxis protein methyltransferase n=1 Tax=Thalassomonas viridans TaxID=137584 RepID=A0AAE9Z0M5_9GAMM|nr:protein-glutamate O-methyltransferase CheR [Thalassomonas viridans]WDE03032.1 protein-glutamate O-methyltransferase CheR [Thalassomonas viridans]